MFKTQKTCFKVVLQRNFSKYCFARYKQQYVGVMEDFSAENQDIAVKFLGSRGL